MENENIEEKEEQKEGQDNAKIYELGYLLLPSTPEDNVVVISEKFKEFIRENGGTFISEDFPKIRNLAYKMKKSIENKNHIFDRAYFGWIKFETNASSVLNLKEQIEKEPTILRSMIIKTVRENTVALSKTAITKKFDLNPDSVPEQTTSEKSSVSEEEIDKSIEELVV